MKRFIKKISIFLGLVLVLVILSFYISLKLVRSNTSFRLKPETKHIVLGHSHPECAYNDSLIGNFQNIAISGEAYFYTYPKARNIIDQNESLETIFIELTNNQISGSINSWIWDDKYLSYHYAIHFPYTNFSDHLTIVKNNPKGFISNLPIVFKTTLKKALASNAYNVPKENGGYKRLAGNMEDYKENKTKNQREDFVSINETISNEQLIYLSKIIAYAKRKNVRVILIRSPMHKSYKGLQNEEQFLELVENNFEDLTFIDLKLFPLTDEEFRDPEHLNYLGAIKVSKWLNTFITSKGFKTGDLEKSYVFSDFN